MDDVESQSGVPDETDRPVDEDPEDIRALVATDDEFEVSPLIPEYENRLRELLDRHRRQQQREPTHPIALDSPTPSPLVIHLYKLLQCWCDFLKLDCEL